MAVTHNCEYILTRFTSADVRIVIPICIDYEYRQNEVTIDSVWRKADENRVDAPEFILTGHEYEKICDYIAMTHVADHNYYD